MRISQRVALILLAVQGLLVVSACQPEVVTIEVTRLVERPAETAPVTDEATPEPAIVSTPLPETTPEPQIITATVTVEVTRPPLGTAERPIQLLFPPVTSSAIISQRAEPLVAALEQATGAEFAVGIADSEQVAVQLMCAAPGDVIAFVSAEAYAIAHAECNAQAGLVAVDSNGLTSEMGMLVTPRSGGATDLQGLADQRWATGDSGSLATYLYFQALLAEAGVTPGELVSRPEDSSALLTLLADEADFTTADFVPPIMPFDRIWTYGEDDPEEWRVLGISPSRSPIGYVLVAGEPEFGGYRLRDARSRLFDTHPEIFDATRIVAVSEPIPNATVVLGADFPLALARQVLATLPEFATSEDCQISLCSADLFGWTGLQPVEDSAYDPIRFVIEKLEIEPAALWELLG